MCRRRINGIHNNNTDYFVVIIIPTVHASSLRNPTKHSMRERLINLLATRFHRNALGWTLHCIYWSFQSWMSRLQPPQCCSYPMNSCQRYCHAHCWHFSDRRQTRCRTHNRNTTMGRSCSWCYGHSNNQPSLCGDCLCNCGPWSPTGNWPNSIQTIETVNIKLASSKKVYTIAIIMLSYGKSQNQLPAKYI